MASGGMELYQLFLLLLSCGLVTSQGTPPPMLTVVVSVGPGEFDEQKNGGCILRNASCDVMECPGCTRCFTLSLNGEYYFPCKFQFVGVFTDSCSTRPQRAEFLISAAGNEAGTLAVRDRINMKELCLGSNSTGSEELYFKKSAQGGWFASTTASPSVKYQPRFRFGANGTGDSVEDAVWIRFRPYRLPKPDRNCGACPPGFMKHGCLCYNMFQLPNVTTWYAANDHCKNKLGAELLSILGDDEMADLKEFLRSVWWSYGQRKYLTGDWFFIGSEDKVNGMDGTSRNRRWTDGHKMTYTEWFQTDESARVGGELGQAIIKTQMQPTAMQASACTIMYIYYRELLEKSSWFKIPCRYPVPNALFICKARARLGAKTNKLVIQGLKKVDSNGTTYVGCGKGWTFRKGQCYMMYTALAALNNTRGQLAFVKSLGGSCSRSNSTVADVSVENGLENVKHLLKIWRYLNEYGPVLVNGSVDLFSVRDYHGVYQDARKEREFFLGQSKENYTSDLMTSYPLRNVICQKAPSTVHVVCQPNQWRCGDGTCISIDYACDTRSDCEDGSDEDRCDHKTFKLFTCRNGTEISYSWRCDFIKHCEDGSDELDCHHWPCGGKEFQCLNKQCIPLTKLCNGVKDCADGSDESDACRIRCRGFTCYSGDCIPKDFKNDIYGDCTGIIMEDEFLDVTDIWRGKFVPTKPKEYPTVYNFEPYCKKSDETRCQFVFTKCFKRSRACVLEDDKFGVMGSCRDGSHLRNCQEYECPGMFKCSKSYCIPMKKRCDHVTDCPYGEDEQGCRAYSCPGYFRCKGRTSCLEQSQVCDGFVDCIDSHDDERNCAVNKCPPSCICRGDVIGCPHAGLASLFNVLPHTLRFLNATGNKLKLAVYSLNNFHHLFWLDLSNNSIEAIPERVFTNSNNLHHLNLAKNNITRIDTFTFSGLIKLRELIMSNNKIKMIASNCFEKLTISVLDLSHQNITEIPDNAFTGMPYITSLLLNNNQINHITDFAFAGLENMTLLNIENNQLGLLRKEVFSGLQLKALKTDRFAYCCAAKEKAVKAIQKGGECTPLPDDFSSCADLLSNFYMMIAMWVLGFLALLGNAFVLIWRFAHRRDGVAVENVLVSNLSIADLLMGIYMIIVAAADVWYRDVFVSFAEEWQASAVCKIAGILSFISSEISVLMLVFITADRVIAIVFAFKFSKITLKQVAILVPITWVLVITFALIPLYNEGMFSKFYGGNAVCLPFSLGRGTDTYGLIFLTINLVAFLLIAVGYLSIYHTIRMSRKRFQKYGQAKMKDSNRELMFVKKMTMVIVSDFCCWVPVVLMKYLAISGVKIPQELSVWTAVFILPLNSSINPFLYTIATIKTWRVTGKSKKPHINSQSTESVKTVDTDVELKPSK